LRTWRTNVANAGKGAVDEIKHELPKQIERHLAALSGLYAHDGQRLLQEIVVNARTRIAEGWTYDWNGGTYGHAVYLAIPEPLFVTAAKKRDDIQKKICSDLNNLHNLQNEHIA
jgi:hypothetical protein